MNLTRVIRTGLLILAGLIVFAAGGLWLSPGRAAAEGIPKQLQVPTDPEGNAACLACHSKDQHMVRDGQEISVQVDPAAYNQSVHGIISCVRCHSEAGPEHAKDPTKPLNLPTGRALKVLKSEGCVKCHAGLYEQSYQASFHGVAVTDGDDRAATCVDCHGVHNILPSRNPDSQVAPANLAKTCSTSDCHKNAPANFAEGKEHLVPSQKTAGGLNVVYKFFMGLILFDVMKDGPIVMFELLRRLRG